MDKVRWYWNTKNNTTLPLNGENIMSTILLDIDGTLSPTISPTTPLNNINPPKLVTHWNGDWEKFSILESEHPEFFDHFPMLPKNMHNSVISSELIESISNMIELGHEVHWFTMWEHLTELLVSNLLGFGSNFPVTMFDTDDSFEWVKMGALTRLLESNPNEFFVLIDDTALDDDQSVEMIESWVDAGRLGVVVPTAHRGISRSEMSNIKLMAEKQKAGIVS